MKKFNFTEEEEVEFIESLYDKCNEEIKKIHSLQQENKDEILKELALILLIYKINNNVMELSYFDRIKLKDKFDKILIKFNIRQRKLTDAVITALLIFVAKKTFRFYGYKYTKEEINRIVNKKYKGKLYTERIINNENKISDYLNEKVNGFLYGKVDVNNINNEIEKAYKQDKDNIETLAETELSRVENLSFLIFAKSIGVKEVIRNEELDDRTCEECQEIDGVIYTLEDAPDSIHPRCRGFNTILYSNGVED